MSILNKLMSDDNWVIPAFVAATVAFSGVIDANRTYGVSASKVGSRALSTDELQQAFNEFGTLARSARQTSTAEPVVFAMISAQKTGRVESDATIEEVSTVLPVPLSQRLRARIMVRELKQ